MITPGAWLHPSASETQHSPEAFLSAVLLNRTSPATSCSAYSVPGTTHAMCFCAPEPQVSYEQLLDAFWARHDPTTLNRQGGDVGTQYR